MVSSGSSSAASGKLALLSIESMLLSTRPRDAGIMEHVQLLLLMVDLKLSRVKTY
jgi:hypothetical protein